MPITESTRRSDPALDTGGLSWLKGGEPQSGRIARIQLRSQADARLLEEIPAESLLPGRTIYECLAAAALVDPSKPAIAHLDSADVSVPARIVTYGQFMEQIVRAANLFVAASGKSPVSVAIVLPMIPEALIAAWAATVAGVVVPINPYLEIHYVVSIMNAARATILVTNAGQFGAASLDDIANRVPTLQRVVILDSGDPNTDYAAAILSAPSKLAFEPVSEPDAPAAYQLTGGTTGAPKLIHLTHRGHLLNAWLNGALQGTSPDGAVGHAMPNFHIGGAIVIALRTFIFSQTLVTLTTQGFRNAEVVRNFWDIARKHRLTGVLATPTTAAAILATPNTTARGHCITAFGCGGSTVPLALSRAFHERFGIWLREQWGLSEAQGTVTGHWLDGNEPLTGSVGSVFPYYRIKMVEVDADNRFVRECAPGERGLLAVSGCITPGYVDESLNRQFFIAGMPDGAVWGNTGDLGSMDERGYVWIFGRAKDLIVRGGHNIDPKLVEDVLITHAAVQLAAAVGRPDSAKGELPMAYVQLKQGATADPRELIDFCRRHCQERASVPVEIVILQEMPTTQVGKISKPVLRKDAMRRAAAAVAVQIIGDRGTVDVSIDDGDLRPKVLLMVALSGSDRGGILEALREAFGKFEFLTAIEIR